MHQPLLSKPSSIPRTIPILGSSLFRFGSKKEGVRDMGSAKTNTAEAGAPYIVKNRRLAVLINVVLNLLYAFLYTFYTFVFTELLKRLELWTAVVIILFVVNPCFLVIWRILKFYSTAYDDYCVASAGNRDIASEIPLEKTSVLV